MHASWAGCIQCNPISSGFGNRLQLIMKEICIIYTCNPGTWDIVACKSLPGDGEVGRRRATSLVLPLRARKSARSCVRGCLYMYGTCICVLCGVGTLTGGYSACACMQAHVRAHVRLLVATIRQAGAKSSISLPSCQCKNITSMASSCTHSLG